MDEKLKNCPFCNGKAEVDMTTDFGFSTPDYVACVDCFAQIWKESKEMAISAWNRRCSYGAVAEDHDYNG